MQAGGNYLEHLPPPVCISSFETSNSAGSLTKEISFEVKDFRPWIYGSNISFPGYTESAKVKDFPVYVELNKSIPGFSYEQFASSYGHDFAFDGRWKNRIGVRAN